MMITKNKNTCLSLGNGFPASSLRNESGVALIAALLFMVVMIALVPMALQLTTAEIDRSQNFKEDRQAFFLAEAGLEHAKALTQQTTLRAVLAGPDDVISIIPSDSENDDNGTFGTGTPFTWNGTLYDSLPFNGTTYYIRARDNDDGDGNPEQDSDNMIILTSVGIVDGITTTVEAMIFNPPGIPIGAVTVNSDFTLSGNPNITGACGNVHSNGDFDITGNPTNIGVTTATGTLTDPPNPDAGGDPVVNVPLLDPTEYEQYADFVLTSSGTVLDSNGDIIPGGLPEWDFSSPKWTLSGNTATDGSYYIEGDVVVSGNPGPFQTTFVATGFIEISGNSQFSNYQNPNDPIDIRNIFMIAGTDVKWNGNANQNVQGLVYAVEQMDLSGNPSINGAVLAYGAYEGDSNSPHGLLTESKIGGDPSITYGCGLSTPTATAIVQVVAWNEL